MTSFRCYEFLVPLIPVKRRVRFMRKTGRTYTDAKTKAEMKAVRDAYTGPKFVGPVKVYAITYGCLPKSIPKKVKSRPSIHGSDADNNLKAILDALNGKAWDDDKQITTACIQKADDTRRLHPRTFIRIMGEVME